MSTLETVKDRGAVKCIDHPNETELSPAAVTFMTTEHFVLQTARSASIAETNGRTALFLSSVSSVLVALAFFGQVSHLGTAFFILALVILPPLFFVGLVTFERAIQTSIEEVTYLRRIARIRRFYLDAAPSLSRYLARVGGESKAEVMHEVGITNSWWQSLVATAGSVAVINGLVLGGTAGLLIAHLNGSLPLSVAIGAVAATTAIALQLVRQRALWKRADGESEREFCDDIGS